MKISRARRVAKHAPVQPTLAKKGVRLDTFAPGGAARPAASSTTWTDAAVVKAQLQSATLTPAAQQLPEGAGISEKVILEARVGRKLLGRFLHKPTSEERAARLEMSSALANLLGLKTPACVARDGGVTTPMIDGVRAASPSYDIGQAPAHVVTELFVARFVDQSLCNLDAWFAQFLVPTGDPTAAITHIDFDEAFRVIPPAELKRAMEEVFGKTDVDMADCGWRYTQLDLNAPIGHSPENWDSKFTMYGPLLKQVIEGTAAFDLAAIEARLDQAAAASPSALLETIERYTGGRESVQLGESSVSSETFRDQLVARLQRAPGEMRAFVREIAAARDDPGHPLRAAAATLDAHPR